MAEQAGERRTILQKGYAEQDWTSGDMFRDPRLPGEYATLLLNKRILPAPDRANGFVFFSPAANQGLFEHSIAKRFDETLSVESQNPPVFIAADFFGGKDKSGKFQPGFLPDIFTDEDLNYVKFKKLSAEGEHIPLRDESVDVLWDRVGALWHAQSERISNPDSEGVVNLLDEYKRVLKGSLIIDAAEWYPGRAIQSTFDFLTDPIDGSSNPPAINVDLEQLGWNFHFIGSGESRLAVLKPNSHKTS